MCSLIQLSLHLLYFEDRFAADFPQVRRQILSRPCVRYLEDQARVRKLLGLHLLSLPLFSVPEPLVQLFLRVTCFLDQIFEINFVPVALVHVVVLNQNLDDLLALSALWEGCYLLGWASCLLFNNLVPQAIVVRALRVVNIGVHLGDFRVGGERVGKVVEGRRVIRM